MAAGRTVSLLCAFVLILHAGKFVSISAQWINHGGDIFNSRYAADEQLINTTSVSSLRLTWRFVAGFDISATPAVYNGTVYFPSWNGNLYAVTADQGSLVWMKNLTELTGIRYGDTHAGENTTLARATPTIAGDDKLIVGLFGPAVVLAVDRANGDLIWMKQIDDHPGALVTMSGTAYNDGFYIGTSSNEEDYASLCCCTFQGSFLRLDIATGAVVWRTGMLPDNGGAQGLYSGAPLWGSSPSIDAGRNLVYIATGNVYGVPPNVAKCQEAQNNMSKPDVPDPCVEPGNHEESMLALDLDTGYIKWSRNLGGYDAWVNACNSRNATLLATCPPAPNPDYDFSDTPSMLTIELDDGSSRDVVLAGQKSGALWTLDRATGELVWGSVTGPGGGGGQIWGTATDGKTIFVNVPNSRHHNWTLSNGEVVTTGGWSAIQAVSGQILWAIQNPTLSTVIGPVSLVNGVVFATSMDSYGTIFALDATSGLPLWNASTGSTIYGGCAIAYNCVFVGNGASVNVGPNYGGTRGDSLFAFCLPN